MNIQKTLKLTSISILVFFGLMVSCSSFKVIEPGFSGVYQILGSVRQSSLSSGFHLKVPLISSIITYDVRELKLETATSTYTKDIQTADIKYAFNYAIDSKRTHLLHTNIGSDYESKILVPFIESAIKDIIGRWDAKDLVSNREKAQIQIYF
ncbi:MAG: SPFH domain-containing protein [Mangrovibacterium sp.]|nr:SPFH domain-containing protein [Mangrovibacterium sp.]